jgi:hypothetical protein
LRPTIFAADLSLSSLTRAEGGKSIGMSLRQGAAVGATINRFSVHHSDETDA